MYAETRLAFSRLLRFQPEFHHHALQSDDSCFLQSNAWASDYRTSAEYDLSGDGDIFTASELLPAENPIMDLDPTGVFSISSETIKISDINSITDDQLLDDVFGDCEDLLADTRVEDAFPELSETANPSSLSVNGDGLSEKMTDPELKVEEQRSPCEKAAAETPLQKSVSSGCLTSTEWINGGEAQTHPNFLGIPGMDLGAVFGMRRAYSEGDIQTLMNHLNVSLVHPPFERLIPLGDPKLEDRLQKLSRYRKKKTKRNFDRKIKYACRKALADSQPRIRGRFAKTEEGEMGRSSKASCI